MKWHKLQKWVFIIFISIVITCITLYYALTDETSINAFRNGLGKFGIWAPLVFVILYTFGTIFIPTTPFMIIAGILFGFKYGILYTLISGFLSSILVFAIARELGKDWVESILKKKHLKYLEKYDERLAKNGILDLMIFRIMPIMPFNILNILMGVSKIKTEDYILGTMLGLTPSIALTVYFGTFIPKLF